MPNTVMMESEENPNPLKEALAWEPFQADEHMSFYVPDGPGLGIRPDPEALERFAVSV